MKRNSFMVSNGIKLMIHIILWRKRIKKQLLKIEMN